MLNSYIVISKGQGLEKNKYFFQVESKDKGKEVLIEEGEEEVLQSNLSLNIEEEEEEEGEEEEDPYKQAFLRDFLKKKEALIQKSNVCLIKEEEPLSPLQKKLKYILYLNNKNLKTLSLQSSLCKEEDKQLLNILLINLKELLYISLERSYYLNELSLQYLNSFQANVIKNKPFRPLLRANSRVKYFNLFSCFIAFVYRVFIKKSYKELFFLSKNALDLLKELHRLAILQEEESLNSKRDLNKEFKQTKKSLNKKLNAFKLDLFLENGELLEEEQIEDLEESSSLLSSLNSALSSSSSSSIDLEGEGEGVNNSNSDSSLRKSKESNSNNILTKIASIGGLEKDNTSVLIKDKLLSLLLLFYKQELDLNPFDSPINAFFACKSIRESNLTLRDSLDLTQYYSAFLYCTQLCVIASSVKKALLQQDSKVIVLEIKDFMSNYFNNTCLFPLSTILNNNAYCKQINTQLFSLLSVSIDPFKKETLTYNKVTISKDELERVF